MNRATLIYDSLTNKPPIVPARTGTPRADQMQGSPLDQLCELAGRVCYDSLGQGRSSEEYHKHIREVNHGSVWEHGTVTFRSESPYFVQFINRPGVWIEVDDKRHYATANLRALREWEEWGINKADYDVAANALAIAAPLVAGFSPDSYGADLVTPWTDAQIWASFYIERVSRCFSHELVRHKFQTAVSQRSTRYCDESEAAFIRHPNGYTPFFGYRDAVSEAYRNAVKTAIWEGKERKTAHGIAARVLPNGVETQLIFSASLAQWKRIFRQRINPAADAEIRGVMEECRVQLAERFPDRNF